MNNLGIAMVCMLTAAAFGMFSLLPNRKFEKNVFFYIDMVLQLVGAMFYVVGGLWPLSVVLAINVLIALRRSN